MITARHTDALAHYAATRGGRISRSEAVWVLRALEPGMTLRSAATITEEYFAPRHDEQRA